MLRKIIYTFIFCFGFISAFAQPKGAKPETIGGKEFYVHTVKSGETLYEIAKMYKSPLADVLNANPGKENKIDIGDKIKIPVTAKNKPKPVEVHTATNNVPPAEKLYNWEHKVEKGETVYGIARKYKTTETDIYDWNPEAKNGISTGQVLKIKSTVGPGNAGTTNVVPPKPVEPKILFSHTVQPQETFFSISRRYNISQDSIKLLNNGLPEGLKAGSIIQLAAPPSKVDLYKSWETAAPVNNSTDNTSNNNGTVNNNVPVAASSDVFRTGKKEVYNIGVMLPLMLDKNQHYMENQNSPDGRTSLYEPTRQALDFQLGVMLALDSLKKAGISTNLKVFDIGKDTNACKKIFASEEFKQLDLLIGPFEGIESAARAAKENKIPMMVPVACSNRVLLDNPYVFKAITTSAVIADEASRYIVNNYKDENLVLIDGRGKNDVGVVKAYSKYLNKYYFEKTGKTDSIKARPTEFSSKTLPGLLRKDRMNIIIIPSNDFAYVSASLNNINKFLGSSMNKAYLGKVIVFGTDEWLKWDQVDITHKLRANVHVPSPTLVDFDTLQTQKLTKSFRTRYKTDPDKYALLGFDLAYFWMAGYAQYGLDFANLVPQCDMTLTQTRFIFNKMNETSGCLNKNVYILRYKDYQLIPQKND